MKTKFLLLSALAALTFVACQRVNDGLLRLYVEGMGDGAKMAVEGGSSYWVTGDKVNINGTEYTIDVSESGNSATVSATGAAEYYGVYPSSIVESRDGANYVLDLPSTYTYATTTHYNRTLQNVAAPMVGYAEIDENGTSMQFKHVTAAIGVQVVNYYGFTVEVDSIVLTSNLYKLCGETNVSLGNNITVLAAEATVDSTKRVKMKFDGDASLHVFAGDSAVVQIPVLPVGASNKFTVDVYLHKVDQPAVAAHFNKEQATAHSMDRRKIGYARTTFGGLFSVSASKKVVISQGNLQYQASTNTWKFAETQDGYIGNAAGNTTAEAGRATQDAWIDLFCWGTGDRPTVISTNSSKFVDWGSCAANNIGSGWRTMTNGSGAEWDYLFKTRSVSTTGLPTGKNANTAVRYVKATVDGKVGIILFPDTYNHPSELTFTTPDVYYNTNTGTAAFNQFVVTSSEWNSMEISGAVFLPAAGRSSGITVSVVGEYAEYWSSSVSSSNGYCLSFNNGYSYIYTSKAKSTGLPVRLVKEVN